MRFQHRGLLAVVLILLGAALVGLALLGIAPFITADAGFQCTIMNNTECAGTYVLYVKNDTGGWHNAHAQNISINTYPYGICCNASSISQSVGTSCSLGATFLNLAATTNSHVEIPSYANYSYPACISVTNRQMACVSGTSCTGAQTCIASIASSEDSLGNSSNAHIDGNCSASYPTKICCSITNAAPVMNTSRITPTTPFQTDMLKGYCNATDADGNNLTYFYKWYNDSVLSSSGNTTNMNFQGIEINAANLTPPFNAGDNWTFECTANDGGLNSSAMNSSSVHITQGCGNITAAGATVTLVQNISINESTCFNVWTNNAVIDCRGYAINGNGTPSTYGISINQSGTTVKNCFISGFQDGVRLNGASSSLVQNNTINSSISSGAGIRTLTNGVGVQNNLITSNNVSSTSYVAYYNQGGSFNNYTNNFAYSPTNACYEDDNGNNTQYVNNSAQIQCNDGYAIYSSTAPNVLVDCMGQTMNGTNLATGSGARSNQYNTTVQNCIIKNFYRGINFNSGGIGNQTAQYNTISAANDSSIYVVSNSFSKLFYNNITSNRYGIQVDLGGNFTYAVGNRIGATGSNSLLLSRNMNTTIENTTVTGGTSMVFDTTSPKLSNVKLLGTSWLTVGVNTDAITINGVDTVLIDCFGNQIVGKNGTSSVGVDVFAPTVNFTMQNCIVKDFFIGINFRAGGLLGRVNNVNVSNSQDLNNTAVSISGTNYTRLSNMTIRNNCNSVFVCSGVVIKNAGSWNNITAVNSTDTKSSSGILINSNNNRVENSVFNSANEGVMVYSSALVGTVLSNIVATGSGGADGFLLGYNVTMTNCTGATATGNGIRLSGGLSNIVANSTFSSSGSAGVSVYVTSASSNNIISNNTFISSSGGANLVVVSSTSGNNTFSYNNFTITTGYYVNDTNATNYYNTSVSGAAQGNYYAGVGSQRIYDMNNDSWGDAGGQYPVNNNTWSSVWAGNGADYGPATARTHVIANVSLMIPTNGNITVHSRNVTFQWNATNPDGETLNFTLQVNSSSLQPACPNYNYTIANNVTNTTIPDNLCVRTEGGGGTYYNWTVKACDLVNCTSWAAIFNFSIEPYVDINLTNMTVNFGTLGPYEIKDTVSNATTPFIVRNDGNVQANLINISANQSLWTSVSLNTQYFQAKANTTSQGINFNYSGSLTNWFNISSSNASVIKALNWTSGNNSAAIDIRVQVPPTEPPGAKLSYIIFSWVQYP